MSRLIIWTAGLALSLSVVCATAQAQSPLPTNRFSFRAPQAITYRVAPAETNSFRPGVRNDYLTAWRENGSGRPVELGNRIVLQVKPGSDINKLLDRRPLQLSRTVGDGVFILQAPDALTASQEAQDLSQAPEVLVSHPVQRRTQPHKHGPYSARPNDTYFSNQWNLENRDSNGVSLGLDLNVREAWAVTRGEGIVIAVADDGVELSHPELASRANNSLHFNFITGTTNALPALPDDSHSTAVAGLALAQANNHRGMSGVAPAAQLASWKIFDGDNFDVTDEGAMDMFQYRSNLVAVQNHSWGNADVSQLGPTTLETIGISNALTFGQSGRGVVMVRSAGNGRDIGTDVNDDGYASDPRVVAVASVRADGRAATYSNRGACVLVAAPGGDSDASVLMTDRQGTAGFNTGTYTNDFADYVNSPSVVGTSFAAPQIAGLVALIRSANTNLTYRDVQQILILSARHFDFADPDLRPNGAGFLVSHNDGFGVPDAGQAINLARTWSNRPPLTTVTLSANTAQAIPDDGLRVLVTGPSAPASLLSIPSAPGTGPHADAPTAVVPLVDVGLASGPIAADLRGKAALIQQDGITDFSVKIGNAARAGAAFAIVYHGTSGGTRYLMGGTDFAPIPAVMIDNTAGLALRTYAQQTSGARVQLRLTASTYNFNVPNTLVCEHVGVRVQSDHTRRGDLRITLLSPQGTRSVLQAVNLDDSPGPVDWTYYSAQHFYESSAGTWTVSVADEEPIDTGSVLSVQLIIRGVTITDTDHDGLDDGWEMARFSSLAYGPKDDPDGDGYNNAREQITGTDPISVDPIFRVDLSNWDDRLARVSWPGTTNFTYQILGSAEAGGPFNLVANIPGRFPETEWFTSCTNLAIRFFQVTR